MTCSLEKENLQTESFLQNNCTATKAVEIMSKNNWCDTLQNKKQRQNEYSTGLQVPVFHSCKKLSYLLHSDKSLIVRDGKKCTSVQYTTKLSKTTNLLSVFLGKQQLDQYFSPASLQICRKLEYWPVSCFLYLSSIAFIKVTR